MAFIQYLENDAILADHQVNDQDNILRIHGIHSSLLKYHLDLFRELMYSAGPLSRIQREMIAVVVSGINGCHY